jgi:hypothetical protein
MQTDNEHARMMRRCPGDSEAHAVALARADRAAAETDAAAGREPGPARVCRSRQELVDVLDELSRRRCGGGPLVQTRSGWDRQDPDDFVGGALVELPEQPDGRGLPQVLADMGIRTVDDLRSFRRLVAIDAALAACAWAAAPPERAAAAAARLMTEVDDPTSAWR